MLKLDPRSPSASGGFTHPDPGRSYMFDWPVLQSANSQVHPPTESILLKHVQKFQNPMFQNQPPCVKETKETTWLEVRFWGGQTIFPFLTYDLPSRTLEKLRLSFSQSFKSIQKKQRNPPNYPPRYPQTALGFFFLPPNVRLPPLGLPDGPWPRRARGAPRSQGCGEACAEAPALKA